MRPSDMRTLLSKVLAFLTGIVVCSGCSVKEDRGLCPCRLLLDFSGVDTTAVRAVNIVMKSDFGFFYEDKLVAEDFRTGVSVGIPRETIRVVAYGGAKGLMMDTGLVIPLGEDCPPVYFHLSEVEADGETVTEKVIMRKNHCVMTVNLNNMEGSPRGITVRGRVDGYLPDGSPSSGDFLYDIPVRDRSGNRVILPRQTDDSLVMEVCDGMGIVRKFPIGEYIAESGYDWNEKDQKDLTLDIDVAVTQVKLVIEGWDVVYKFEVVI